MGYVFDDGGIERVILGYHRNPHEILGMHTQGDETAICAYIPNAESIDVIFEKSGISYTMTKRDHRGFFTLVLPGVSFDYFYKFRVTDYTGHVFETYDPYSFWPTVSDYDLYLFNEGTHHRIYEN